MDPAALNFQNGSTRTPRQRFKRDYQFVWHRGNWAFGMLHINLVVKSWAVSPYVMVGFCGSKYPADQKLWAKPIT
jgi:hypothetical protein